MEGRKKARVELGAVPHLQTIEHPTLRRYYGQIATLRVYLISRLPASAKSRRRKIETASVSKPESLATGTGTIARGEGGGTAPGSSDRSDVIARRLGDSQTRLAALLDNTLVCTPETYISAFNGSREKDFIAFSQKADISLGSTLDGGTTSISDVSNSGRFFFKCVYYNPAGVNFRRKSEIEIHRRRTVFFLLQKKFDIDHLVIRRFNRRSS